MTKDEEIEILKENVRQLQQQLTAAYIRIKELTPKERETNPIDRNFKWSEELLVLASMNQSNNH